MGRERFNLYLNSTQTNKTSNFTATITTTVLTISVAATYGSFPLLTEIMGGPYTVVPGTVITSYGTGDITGKAGTYNLSISQTGGSAGLVLIMVWQQVRVLMFMTTH
jgi:hypothetical protein